MSLRFYLRVVDSLDGAAAGPRTSARRRDGTAAGDACLLSCLIVWPRESRGACITALRRCRLSARQRGSRQSRGLRAHLKFSQDEIVSFSGKRLHSWSAILLCIYYSYSTCTEACLACLIKARYLSSLAGLKIKPMAMLYCQF